MVKIRPIKYMFFANIFVNIDPRETDTIYNILDLVVINKSNSMRFLTIVYSFRVLGYQMCKELLFFFVFLRFWQIYSLIPDFSVLKVGGWVRGCREVGGRGYFGWMGGFGALEGWVGVLKSGESVGWCVT